MPICIEFEGDCIGWLVSSIALLFGWFVGVVMLVFWYLVWWLLGGKGGGIRGLGDGFKG